MKNLLKLFITSSLFILTSIAMAGNDCPLKFDVNKYETTINSYDEIELPKNEFNYLKFDVNEWTYIINNKDWKHIKHMKNKGYPEVKKKM